MKHKKFRIKLSKIQEIVSAIMIGVIMLTLGYSAYGQPLYVNDVALDIRPEEDIRVSGARAEDSYGVTISNLDYNTKQIYGDSDFSTPGHTAWIYATVTNYGNVDKGIYAINPTGDGYDFTVNSADSSKIKKRLKQGESVTISMFQQAVHSSPGSFAINFDFRNFFNVAYSGFNSTTNYPVEVMEGDTLKVTFNQSVTSSQITISGSYGTSSLSGNTLTVTNVKSNLNISYGSHELYDTIAKLSRGPDSTGYAPTNPGSYAIAGYSPGVYTQAMYASQTYPVYYYKGKVDNNNVLFAGFCWKIIRTTENGEVKLIYNGIPNTDPSADPSGSTYMCGTGRSDNIGSAMFNTPAYGIGSVGYRRSSYMPSSTTTASNKYYYYATSAWYDSTNSSYALISPKSVLFSNRTPGDGQGEYTFYSTSMNPRSTVVYYQYAKNLGSSASATSYHYALYNEHTIENVNFGTDYDSVVKSTLDSWYSKNLSSYATYIADVPYYNDRTAINGPFGRTKKTTDFTTKFQSYDFVSSFKWSDILSVFSSEKYSYLNIYSADKFTKTASGTHGNGKLTYPIGLITAVEAKLASGDSNKDSPVENYLVSDYDYWTMTPSSMYIKLASTGFDTINMFVVGYSMGGPESAYPGKLAINITERQVGSSNAIRPVIALTKGITYTSGTGRSNEPYVIKS